MKVKAMIIDDVELAREHIRRSLLDDDIEIVAECGSGPETVKMIRKVEPDLLFLDVRVRKVDGFDIIKAVGVEATPTIVFVTSYDEFAQSAFEVNAADYLLKPFNRDRLDIAVQRAKRLINGARTRRGKMPRGQRIEDERQYVKRIPVKYPRGTVLISANDIDWIGSAGHYLELYVGRERHLIREKLTDFEQKLDPQNFARIHRSTIVNLDRVKSLHPLFNGDQMVTLDNGRELNLSRTYSEKVISRLVGG